MEIEAKFTVPDPGVYWQLQTIESLAGYALATQEARSMRDTYLDTAKRDILAAGYSCRQRQMPDGIVMTLKSLDQAEGAIHRRQEFEVSLPKAMSPAEWPESAARERVLQLSRGQPLKPLFKLTQTRIIRMLRQDEQSLAEFSLDRVWLIVYGKEHIYHELEVELLPSRPEQILNAVVECLLDDWHLQSVQLSKFERALALVDATVAV